MTRRPGSRQRHVVLILATTTMLATAGAGADAASACITTLPVNASFPTPFAAAYQRTLPVRLTTTGPAIRGLTAALYTFGGERVASGAARATLTGSTTVRMRLRFTPMQAGRFTLALYGEPNADPSCGPKHRFRVVRFRPCPRRLPVTFPGTPVRDGGQLTISVAAGRSLVRGLSLTLSALDGEVLGRRTIPTLFGAKTVSFRLPRAAEAANYTVTARGRLDRQPRSCAAATRELAIGV